MIEQSITHAEKIDPLLNWAGQRDFMSEPVAVYTDNQKVGLKGWLKALTGVTAAFSVVNMPALQGEDSVALAQNTPCVAPAIPVNWFDANQNGIPDAGDDFVCYTPPATTAKPPTPTTVKPGGGGSNTGGGSTGGGNNPATPVAPAKPSWPDILAFSGCADGKGDGGLSDTIDQLGGTAGIQRLEEMIAKCAFVFIPNATDPSQNNWNALIANPDANITPPNPAQSDAMSAYMQEAWDKLYAPESTTTTTEVKIETESTEAQSSTTLAPATQPTEVEQETEPTDTTILGAVEGNNNSNGQEEGATDKGNGEPSKVSETVKKLVAGIAVVATVIGTVWVSVVLNKRRQKKQPSPSH